MKSIILILAATTMLAACHVCPVQKKAVASKYFNCDPRTPATIPYADVDSEVILNNGRMMARGMKNESAFSTSMAVALCAMESPPAACVGAPEKSIDFHGATMEITPAGLLSITTADGTTDSAPLSPAAVSPARVGFLSGYGTTKNKYYVYFYNALLGTLPQGYKWLKTYRVEVYYPDGTGDYLCKTQMPDYVDSSTPISEPQSGSGEGGVGGGTEPGH